MALTVVKEYTPLGQRGSGGWRATIGPLSVIGPNKTEARERLTDLVEKSISGSWDPVMMSYGESNVLVYRTPHGWGYRFWSILRAFSRDGVTISCGTDTREQAISLARKHLAQAAWPTLNGMDLLAGDHAATLDHLHWIGFQRAYAKALSMTGFTESSMHQYACDKANEDEFLTPDELIVRDAARHAHGAQIF